MDTPDTSMSRFQKRILDHAHPPRSERPLTPRQADIHRFLYEMARDQGVQPTYREIAAQFDIRSTNGVTCHLFALAVKGYLAVRPLRHGFLFLRRPDGSPFTGFIDKEPLDVD